MKIKSLQDGDFYVNGLIITHYNWEVGYENNYVLHPRKQNLIYYLLEGSYHYEMGSNSFNMSSDQYMFMPVAHKYISTANRETHGYTIEFQMYSYSGEIVQPDLPYNSPITDSDGHLRTICENMYHEYMHGGENRLKLYSYFYRLLNEYTSITRRSLILESEYAALLPAIEYLESCYNINTGIADIAKMCFLSETNFRTKFKKFSGGISPTEYRTKIKVKKAADMLTSDTCSIEKAAADTGFYDTAHFYRVFEKYMGITPSKYKHMQLSNVK